MRLTPSERDRLLIFSAAELARRRLARGLLLNAPEAEALIADTVCEVARDGGRHAEAVAAGRGVLTRAQALDGVPELVGDVAVEAVFDDGTRLVVVSDPFGPAEPHDAGTLTAMTSTEAASLPPGTLLPAATPPRPDHRDTVAVRVTNTGPVPISVTSHFHFFEVNRRLAFDRAAGYGRRLAIGVGGMVRWAPGETREVNLVPIGGARIAIGFSGLVDGPLDAPGAKQAALQRAHERGYLDTEAAQS
ncbi:urease subunit gamma [Nocardioides limicola]|uniref:urease subunit gamma n=1 Tax=Nocardioides limicola TaxID=2803368 RepID=UPI00193C8281|nr:urease subunit gamma [Nocardioides sp. DJM-14]